jgi:integrase
VVVDDFSVNGVRYRQPIRDAQGQRTKDWREALSREKELIADAQAGKLTVAGQSFARLAFTEAVERYIADRLARIQPKTARIEKERAGQLKKYFGTTAVCRIPVDSIFAYIAKRKQAGASNATINRNLDMLRGVLKRAKRWHTMAEDIRPLPMRHNVGRALTHDEELRLLKLAAAKPEWLNARLAAVLALNSTMRAGEIRGLRWQSVDLIERAVTVRRDTTKTDAGERVIPLNAAAWAAILELRERAKLLFGVEPQPDWYLFPHNEGFCKPDPTRPMSGWGTAWRNLTRAIYCPSCRRLQQPAEKCRNEKCGADIRGVRSPLHGFRFHDCRHHSITRLCEAQANDSIIREIAGHVSPKMLAHYSHVRMDAKRKALDALSARPLESISGRSTGGYGTNHDTNSAEQPASRPQVTEKNGGADGIRTHDLLDAIEARSQLRHGPTAVGSLVFYSIRDKAGSNHSKRAVLAPKTRRAPFSVALQPERHNGIEESSLFFAVKNRTLRQNITTSLPGSGLRRLGHDVANVLLPQRGI